MRVSGTGTLGRALLHVGKAENETMSKAPDTRGERQKQLEERPALGEAGAPAQGGRKGGALQRKIASRDEEKRSYERPAGLTRVRKSDKQVIG
jgi:hypothetical protein